MADEQQIPDWGTLQESMLRKGLDPAQQELVRKTYFAVTNPDFRPGTKGFGDAYADFASQAKLPHEIQSASRTTGYRDSEKVLGGSPGLIRDITRGGSLANMAKDFVPTVIGGTAQLVESGKLLGGVITGDQETIDNARQRLGEIEGWKASRGSDFARAKQAETDAAALTGRAYSKTKSGLFGIGEVAATPQEIEDRVRTGAQMDPYNLVVSNAPMGGVAAGSRTALALTGRAAIDAAAKTGSKAALATGVAAHTGARIAPYAASGAMEAGGGAQQGYEHVANMTPEQFRQSYGDDYPGMDTMTDEQVRALQQRKAIEVARVTAGAAGAAGAALPLVTDQKLFGLAGRVAERPPVHVSAKTRTSILQDAGEEMVKQVGMHEPIEEMGVEAAIDAPLAMGDAQYNFGDAVGDIANAGVMGALGAGQGVVTGAVGAPLEMAALAQQERQQEQERQQRELSSPHAQVAVAQTQASAREAEVAKGQAAVQAAQDAFVKAPQDPASPEYQKAAADLATAKQQLEAASAAHEEAKTALAGRQKALADRMIEAEVVDVLGNPAAAAQRLAQRQAEEPTFADAWRAAQPQRRGQGATLPKSVEALAAGKVSQVADAVHEELKKETGGKPEVTERIMQTIRNDVAQRQAVDRRLADIAGATPAGVENAAAPPAAAPAAVAAAPAAAAAPSPAPYADTLKAMSDEELLNESRAVDTPLPGRMPAAAKREAESRRALVKAEVLRRSQEAPKPTAADKQLEAVVEGQKKMQEEAAAEAAAAKEKKAAPEKKAKEAPAAEKTAAPTEPAKSSVVGKPGRRKLADALDAAAAQQAAPAPAPTTAPAKEEKPATQAVAGRRARAPKAAAPAETPTAKPAKAEKKAPAKKPAAEKPTEKLSPEEAIAKLAQGMGLAVERNADGTVAKTTNSNAKPGPVRTGNRRTQGGYLYIPNRDDVLTTVSTVLNWMLEALRLKNEAGLKFSAMLNAVRDKIDAADVWILKEVYKYVRDDSDLAALSSMLSSDAEIDLALSPSEMDFSPEQRKALVELGNDKASVDAAAKRSAAATRLGGAAASRLNWGRLKMGTGTGSLGSLYDFLRPHTSSMAARAVGQSGADMAAARAEQEMRRADFELVKSLLAPFSDAPAEFAVSEGIRAVEQVLAEAGTERIEQARELSDGKFVDTSTEGDVIRQAVAADRALKAARSQILAVNPRAFDIGRLAHLYKEEKAKEELRDKLNEIIDAANAKRENRAQLRGAIKEVREELSGAAGTRDEYGQWDLPDRRAAAVTARANAYIKQLQSILGLDDGPLVVRDAADGKVYVRTESIEKILAAAEKEVRRELSNAKFDEYKLAGVVAVVQLQRMLGAFSDGDEYKALHETLHKSEIGFYKNVLVTLGPAAASYSYAALKAIALSNPAYGRRLGVVGMQKYQKDPIRNMRSGMTSKELDREETLELTSIIEDEDARAAAGEEITRKAQEGKLSKSKNADLPILFAVRYPNLWNVRTRSEDAAAKEALAEAPEQPTDANLKIGKQVAAVIGRSLEDVPGLSKGFGVTVRNLAKLAAGSIERKQNETGLPARLQAASAQVAAVKTMKQHLFSELWVATAQRNLAAAGGSPGAASAMSMSFNTVLGGTPADFDESFRRRVAEEFRTPLKDAAGGETADLAAKKVRALVPSRTNLPRGERENVIALTNNPVQQALDFAAAPPRAYAAEQPILVPPKVAGDDEKTAAAVTDLDVRIADLKLRIAALDVAEKIGKRALSNGAGDTIGEIARLKEFAVSPEIQRPKTRLLAMDREQGTYTVQNPDGTVSKRKVTLTTNTPDRVRAATGRMADAAASHTSRREIVSGLVADAAAIMARIRELEAMPKIASTTADIRTARSELVRNIRRTKSLLRQFRRELTIRQQRVTRESMEDLASVSYLPTTEDRGPDAGYENVKMTGDFQKMLAAVSDILREQEANRKWREDAIVQALSKINTYELKSVLSMRMSANSSGDYQAGAHQDKYMEALQKLPDRGAMLKDIENLRQNMLVASRNATVWAAGEEQRRAAQTGGEVRPEFIAAASELASRKAAEKFMSKMPEHRRAQLLAAATDTFGVFADDSRVTRSADRVESLLLASTIVDTYAAEQYLNALVEAARSEPGERDSTAAHDKAITAVELAFYRDTFAQAANGVVVSTVNSTISDTAGLRTEARSKLEEAGFSMDEPGIYGLTNQVVQGFGNRDISIDTALSQLAANLREQNRTGGVRINLEKHYLSLAAAARRQRADRTNTPGLDRKIKAYEEAAADSKGKTAIMWPDGAWAVLDTLQQEDADTVVDDKGDKVDRLLYLAKLKIRSMPLSATQTVLPQTVEDVMATDTSATITSLAREFRAAPVEFAQPDQATIDWWNGEFANTLPAGASVVRVIGSPSTVTSALIRNADNTLALVLTIRSGPDAGPSVTYNVPLKPDAGGLPFLTVPASMHGALVQGIRAAHQLIAKEKSSAAAGRFAGAMAAAMLASRADRAVRQNLKAERTGTPADGMRAEDAQRRLEQIFGVGVVRAWIKSGRLKIVQSASEVTNDLEHAHDSGLYDTDSGRAYLVADNMTPGTVYSTFLHEVGGHQMWDGLFGPHYERLMNQINQMIANGQKDVTDVVNSVKANYGENHPDFLEEVVVHLAQSALVNRGRMPGPVMSFLSGAWQALRAELIRRGWFGMSIKNPEDLVSLMEGALWRSRLNAMIGREEGPTPRATEGEPGALMSAKPAEGASAFEAAKVAAATAGKSIVEAARWIADTKKSGAPESTSVVMHMVASAVSKLGTAAAHTIPDGATVRDAAKRLVVDAFRAISEDPAAQPRALEAKERLTTLAADVRAHFDKNPYSPTMTSPDWARNIYQLMDEGLTNPEVSAALRKINFPDREPFANKALGILFHAFGANRLERNALTELLYISNNLLVPPPGGGNFKAAKRSSHLPVKAEIEGMREDAGSLEALRSVGAQLTDIAAKLPRRIGLKLYSAKDLAARWGDKFPALNAFRDALQKADAEVARHIAKPSEVAQRWRRHVRQRRQLGKMMRDATFARIFVDEHFGDERSFLIDHPWYHGDPRGYQRYRELRADYMKLDGVSKQLYQDVRRYYENTLEEMKSSITNMIEATTDPGPDRDAEISRINQWFREAQEGPYFPLARFGKHIVDGFYKDASGTEHKFNLAFESEVEAREAASRLAKEPSYYDVRRFTATESEHDKLELHQPVLQAVYKKLAGEDEKENRALLQQLYTAQRMLSRENSVAVHTLRRGYVIGASGDMLRAFSRSVVTNAHFLSRVNNTRAISDAVTQIETAAKSARYVGGAFTVTYNGVGDTREQRVFSTRAEADDFALGVTDAKVAEGTPSEDLSVAEDIRNEVQRRYSAFAAPQNPDEMVSKVSTGASAATTFFFLTTSLVYPMMNAMQQLSLGVPMLLKQFGNPARVFGSLSKMYVKSLGILLSSGLHDALTRMRLAEAANAVLPDAVKLRPLEEAINNSAFMTPAEKAFLIKGIENNHINISGIFDLLSMGDTSFEEKLGVAGAVKALSSTIFNLAAIPAKYTEIANRMTLALAAHELMSEHPAPAMRGRAEKYAWDTVEDAHFDYGSTTRASLFSQATFGAAWPLARAFLQFKSYITNTYVKLYLEGLYPALKATFQSAKEKAGSTPEAQAQLRDAALKGVRMLTMVAAIQTALTGVNGLPGMDAVYFAANQVRNLAAEEYAAPADTKVDVLRYMTDELDADNANGILFGYSRLLGFDLYNSLGLQSGIPGTSDYGVTPAKGFDGYLDAAANIMPAARMVSNWVTGAGLIADGMVQEGVAMMAPRGVGNYINYSEGRIRSQSGYERVGGLDSTERLLGEIGIKSAQEVDTSFRASAQIPHQQAQKQRVDSFTFQMAVALDNDLHPTKWTALAPTLDEVAKEAAAWVQTPGNEMYADQIGAMVNKAVAIQVANEAKRSNPELAGAPLNNIPALVYALELSRTATTEMLDNKGEGQ